MTMSSRIAVSRASLLIVVALLASHPAHAESAPDDESASAWPADQPAVQSLHRILVISFDNQSRYAGWVRDEVARKLARAGHEVATLANETADRATTAKLADRCRGFDALGIVKISTAGGKQTVVLDLYGPSGQGIVELSGPVLTPPAPPPFQVTLDPTTMSGPAFYDAMDRHDLSLKYQRNRTAKSVLLGVGGVGVVLGLVLAAFDSAAVAAGNTVEGIVCIGSQPSSPSCQPAQTSDVPWAIAGVGLVSILVGAIIQTDPLTEPERRTLYEQRVKPAPQAEGIGDVRIGAAPALHGAGSTLFVSARF
jgi:hypothetical protein